jgi:cytochrome c biogenesis protein CcmG/thiol:disulfide interchange protein DsbE
MTSQEPTAALPTDVDKPEAEATGYRLLGMPIGAVVAILAVVGLLVIVGLGLVRTQRGPAAVGSTAPSFTLQTFEGAQHSLAQYRGQVVVVNFWASWCIPCEEEAAELQQAYLDYRDQGVVFLGVNYVDTEPEAKAYMEKFNITYPSGPDLGTEISQAFRIRGVPETYIIGPSGRITSVEKGPYPSLEAIELSIDQAFTR